MLYVARRQSSQPPCDFESVLATASDTIPMTALWKTLEGMYERRHLIILFHDPEIDGHPCLESRELCHL